MTKHSLADYRYLRLKGVSRLRAFVIVLRRAFYMRQVKKIAAARRGS